MIEGTRNDVKKSILFFRRRRVPIEDIIEDLVDNFRDRVVSSKVRWQDVVDELSDALFKTLKPSDNKNETYSGILCLCELTANYVKGIARGENYKNVYDFAAKNYPKLDIPTPKLYNRM